MKKNLRITIKTEVDIRPATREETYGSGGRSAIRATYAQLVKKFGGPHFLGSADDKVQAEWVFMLTHNEKEMALITIYDYKEDKPKEKVTYWHIGGRGASETMADFLKNYGLELLR